jgi:hypothetical protein
MQAGAVVKARDVVGDIPSRFSCVGVVAQPDSFHLQAQDDSKYPCCSCCTIGRTVEAMCLVVRAGLAAAVRVHNQPRCWLACAIAICKAVHTNWAGRLVIRVLNFYRQHCAEEEPTSAQICAALLAKTPDYVSSSFGGSRGTIAQIIVGANQHLQPDRSLRRRADRHLQFR